MLPIPPATPALRPVKQNVRGWPGDGPVLDSKRIRCGVTFRVTWTRTPMPGASPGNKYLWEGQRDSRDVWELI